MVKIILYYFFWLINSKLLRKDIPLNGSIILTDKCNLKCKHCSVSNLGYKNLNFKGATKEIRNLYDLGVRALVITGGEPFLWQDKNYKLEDIVKFAQKIGFFRVVICTNGTFDLKSDANYLWVSLDGVSVDHNKIRGNIYSKVMGNIIKSRHKNIFVNFTVSRLNINHFETSVSEILKCNKIKGILFHIFTPYIGAAKIELSQEQRENVLKKIYQIKKKNPIRIVNSFDGLKAMLKNDWERPVGASVLFNQGKKNKCCCREGIYNDYTCKHCGCSPAVETWVLYKLKPLAIIENLRYLFW